jgi:predicted transcriptional regulator
MRREGLSLSERLHRWLELHPDQWINGGEFERLAMDVGYKGSTASRELRLMAEAGQIEREERAQNDRGVKSVWYRYSADMDYRPRNEREVKEIEFIRKHNPKYLSTYKSMLKIFNEYPVKKLSPPVL